MKCTKCQAELEDGAVFCSECGAKVGEADAAPGDTAGGEAAPKAKTKLPLIIGGAAAVVVVAAGGLALSGGLGSSSGSSGSAPSEIMYISDGSFYGINLKDAKADPVEYTDDFFESSDQETLPSTRLTMVTLSKDGKYRFFPERYDNSDNTFNLFCQKGTDDPVKLVSGISRYSVTDSNQVIYMKDGSLYVGTTEDQGTKVDSDVASFYLSRDGKHLIWSVSAGEDRAYDYYTQDTGLQEKKEKLISDASLSKYTANFESILFQKEDALYLAKDLAKAEKLVDEVISVMSPDLEKGTFFYTAEGENVSKASAYVTDDTAESDALITEPVRSAYERQEIVGTYSKRLRTVVDDAYYTELEKYREKEKRDELRKQLEEAEITVPYTSLYFYANGESTLVTDSYLDGLDEASPSSDKTGQSKEFTSAFFYERAIPDEDASSLNVKLSEISSISDIQSMVNSASTEETGYFLYSNGAEKELDLDDKQLLQSAFDEKNNLLYLLIDDAPKKDEEKNDDRVSGELVSVSLSDTAAELTDYAEDVSVLNGIYDGNVYYQKDINKGYGDLYRNEDCVLYDVSENDVYSVPYSSSVIALTDCDKEKAQGTLNLLAPGSEDAVEIASDVYTGHPTFTAFGDNCILMLADYRTDRGTGDLLYYDGKETRTLADDVSAYFFSGYGSDAYLAGDTSPTSHNNSVSGGAYYDYYSNIFQQLLGGYGGSSSSRANSSAAAAETEAASRWR